MKIKIDHINMTVKNIEQTLDWYHRLFGFEKVESGLTQLGKNWAIIAKDDSMIAMTELSDKLPNNQDKSINHRIYHFGIRVDDEALWIEKIKKYDLRLGYGGVIEYPNSKSWYVTDPSGYEIEVSFSNGNPLVFPK